jgi:hypothetical protein
VTPSASAGNLAIVDCIVTALGGNGITITGASTTLTLLNSQVLVQAGNSVAPISVAGIYSIINTIYDKPGSTLTGTSTNSIDYFQYINADKFITQGGTSNQFVKGDGSLDSTGPISGTSGTSGSSGTSGTSGISLPFTSGAWGSFISTQSQYVTSTTTAYSMSAATQTSGNGVIVSADTRFIVASAGTYNLQFSCQIESTGGGSAQTMDIWLAINGNNVDNSNTQVVGNSNNGRSVAAWNFVEPLNAGDYMELKFRVSDIRLGFAYDIAQINPTRPAIPSVIITVTQV